MFDDTKNVQEIKNAKSQFIGQALVFFYELKSNNIQDEEINDPCITKSSVEKIELESEEKWLLEQVATIPTSFAMKEKLPSVLNFNKALTEQEVIELELQEEQNLIEETEICYPNQLGRKELAVILSQYITAMLPNNEGLVLDENKINPTNIYHRSHPGLRPKVIEFSYCSPCSEKNVNIPKRKIKKNCCNHKYTNLFQKDLGLPEGYEYDIYCPSEQLDLRDLVLAFQHHDKNHRSSCFRDGCDYCRYHFPWHLRVATVILMLKLKGKKHYALQTLVRRNNRWINNYIPWVLMHYRANMDWKFITSTTGTAIYSCMYSSKAEVPDKKLINAKIWKHLAADEQNGLQGDTRKLVYLASMAVHNSKQSGAQEAANEALGNGIVSSTHNPYRVFGLDIGQKPRFVLV